MSRIYAFFDVQTVTEYPQDKFKVYVGSDIQNKNMAACVSMPYNDEQLQSLLRVLGFEK
jgi:hypothetical protein